MAEPRLVPFSSTNMHGYRYACDPELEDQLNTVHSPCPLAVQSMGELSFSDNGNSFVSHIAACLIPAVHTHYLLLSSL